MTQRCRRRDEFPGFWLRLGEVLQVPIKAIVWFLLLPFWFIVVVYEWWVGNWKS